MATVEIIEVEPVEPPKLVVLKLTIDEAKYVKDALRQTQPSDKSPIDSATDPVWDALDEVPEAENSYLHAEVC